MEMVVEKEVILEAMAGTEAGKRRKERAARNRYDKKFTEVMKKIVGPAMRNGKTISLSCSEEKTTISIF